jgi:type IV secretion system protein VirD4
MNLIYFRKVSVVVNDVKYENYIKTSGFRRRFSDVYLFDISGRFPQNDVKYCSHCWNPFTYISRDPLYRQKDLRNIANIVYAKELEGKNKFFSLIYFFLSWYRCK